jgi:hypothetical protein
VSKRKIGRSDIGSGRGRWYYKVIDVKRAEKNILSLSYSITVIYTQDLNP